MTVEKNLEGGESKWVGQLTDPFSNDERERDIKNC